MKTSLLPLAILALAACKDEVAGDLRFTEVEVEGVHIGGQWIEITYLHRTGTRSLSDVEVELSGTRFTLPDVDIGPGERFVIGTAEAEADIPVDLVEDFELGSVPTVRLFDRDGEILHDLTFGSDYPPLLPGSSISRDPEKADGVDAWCLTWESSPLDFATPGELNGPCRCGMVFDFHYRSVDDPSLDVTGTERITLAPSGQYSLSTDTQGGEYFRDSDAEGQHIEWTYSGTGIVYRGTRAYGEEAFLDEPIEIPDEIEGYGSGTWSSVGDAVCSSVLF